jgi:hypothetical protein
MRTPHAFPASRAACHLRALGPCETKRFPAQLAVSSPGQPGGLPPESTSRPLFLLSAAREN